MRAREHAVCVGCASCAQLHLVPPDLTSRFLRDTYTTRWQGRRSARLSWIFEVIEGLMLREGPSREVRKIMHREREREVSAR